MSDLHHRLMVAHQMATRPNPDLRLTDDRAAQAMLAVVSDHLHRQLESVPAAWHAVRTALSRSDSEAPFTAPSSPTPWSDDLIAAFVKLLTRPQLILVIKLATKRLADMPADAATDGKDLRP